MSPAIDRTVDQAGLDLQERVVRITIVAGHINEMSHFDDDLAHLVGNGVIAAELANFLSAIYLAPATSYWL